MLPPLEERSAELFTAIATYGAVGAVFGIVRFLALGRYANWREAAASWFISVSVAVVAGYLAQGLGWSNGAAFFCAAVGSLLSENLIVAFLVVGKRLEKDPLDVIKKLKG